MVLFVSLNSLGWPIRLGRSGTSFGRRCPVSRDTLYRVVDDSSQLALALRLLAADLLFCLMMKMDIGEKNLIGGD